MLVICTGNISHFGLPAWVQVKLIHAQTQRHGGGYFSASVAEALPSNMESFLSETQILKHAVGHLGRSRPASVGKPRLRDLVVPASALASASRGSPRACSKSSHDLASHTPWRCLHYQSSSCPSSTPRTPHAKSCPSSSSSFLRLRPGALSWPCRS